MGDLIQFPLTRRSMLRIAANTGIPGAAGLLGLAGAMTRRARGGVAMGRATKQWTVEERQGAVLPEGSRITTDAREPIREYDTALVTLKSGERLVRIVYRKHSDPAMRNAGNSWGLMLDDADDEHELRLGDIDQVVRVVAIEMPSHRIAAAMLLPRDEAA